MERYAKGDADAFGELYELLASRLTAFVLRRTRDPVLAEDIVQQTFLQMHSARLHFSPGATVMPWSFTIARRILIDHLRCSEREVPCDNADGRLDRAAPDWLPDRALCFQQLATRVERHLEKLPQSSRAAFELVQLEGLPISEAATILGTTVPAVRVRTHRARKALRSTLGSMREVMQ
jgi:RNA polymerase sigma-70 factor (ECF subfamily)